MEAVEVPQYFTCPISLQIMEDPVTVPTGITYDRASIERWFFIDRNATCPVSNQPLPPDSELTPNHTLRRLIQAWCTLNASRGIERIPTPKAPIDKTGVLKLLQDLSAPHLQMNTLTLMASLATESESNRRCMVHAGVPSHLIQLISTACSNKNQADRLELALGVLHRLRVPLDDLKPLVTDNYDLIQSFTWILQHGSAKHQHMRSNAILALKSIFEVASQNFLERLKVDFFEAVIKVLHERISQQETKAALHVLLSACPWGRNRTRIVEAGAVTELIELELTVPDKKTTELVLGVLDHLCSLPDGRAQLVGHAAGIALVSKRILRVSPVADERATRILSSVCKYSSTNEVVQEMLRVGAVSKLCIVLQANCSSVVKENARWVLRLHSEVWKDSPCINVYLLTRYP